jgi:hypothetical protein
MELNTWKRPFTTCSFRTNIDAVIFPKHAAANRSSVTPFPVVAKQIVTTRLARKITENSRRYMDIYLWRKLRINGPLRFSHSCCVAWTVQSCCFSGSERSTVWYALLTFCGAAEVVRWTAVVADFSSECIGGGSAGMLELWLLDLIDAAEVFVRVSPRLVRMD